MRKFGSRDEKLLTVPQKDKVLTHLRGIRAYLDAHKQTPAVQVIKALNPVIRGWAQYYRHVSAKAVLAKVGHAQWHMLWRWAKRRHPKKSCAWVKARYYRNEGYWAFREGKAELVKPERTPITRFTKVAGKNSPYDASPLDRESASKWIILSPHVMVGQTISTIHVWSILGVIGNSIKRTGDNGQGLEPDEGQSSCPVLRGLESGNTLWLPGGGRGSSRTGRAQRRRCLPLCPLGGGEVRRSVHSSALPRRRGAGMAP